MRTTREMQRVANFVTDAGLATNYGIGSGSANSGAAGSTGDMVLATIYGIGTRDVPSAIDTQLKSMGLWIDAYGASDWGRPAAFAMTVPAGEAQIETLRTFLAGL